MGSETERKVSSEIERRITKGSGSEIERRVTKGSGSRLKGRLVSSS